MILDIATIPARLKATIGSLDVINDTGFWFMEYYESIITPVAGVNVGYLIFFPFISLTFDIEINKSISYFFNFFFFFGFLWALYFFLKIKKISLLKKIIILFILIYSFRFVSSTLFNIAGEYLFYFLPPIMLIPFFYYIRDNTQISNSFLYLCFFIISLLGIIFSLIKDHAMIGSILFGCILLFNNIKIRYLSLSSMFIIILISKIIINYVEYKQIKNYVNIYNKKPEVDYLINSSPYHSFYSGLAFTNNYYVRDFRDNDTAKMLRAKNKNYTIFHTKQNHQIAKEEIIRIIKEDLNFFVRNIFAKFGVILLWFLVYCNIGILYFYANKVRMVEKISFLAITMFYSLFPIIAIPTSFYMMGIYSICTSLLICFVLHIDKQKFQTILNSLKNFAKS